jgi:membrane-associated phospholipid phosphatase
VATTRVLLGVHWLTDVIAGAIVGWMWFVLVTVLFGGRILKFGEPAERIAEDKVTATPQDRREVETPA